MSFARIIKLAAVAAFAAFVITMLSTVAEAQCSMCRTALAGSGNANFIRNFNIGVLVLLVPPVAMFCSFFVILRRHKLEDDEKKQDR